MIDQNAATLMTAQEVAKRLNVHVNFVYSLIHDKELEAHYIGKSYRISEDALQNYLDRTRGKVK
jgi:excisionase family DNA binding protein